VAGAPPRVTALHVLRRATSRLVLSKRAVRRGVGALVPVVPTDSVPRVRIVVDDFLDYPAARGALARLRLGENAISR
jgi:hypothetical protein